jgi:hypothetical protein
VVNLITKAKDLIAIESYSNRRDCKVGWGDFRPKVIFNDCNPGKYFLCKSKESEQISNKQISSFLRGRCVNKKSVFQK